MYKPSAVLTAAGLLLLILAGCARTPAPRHAEADKAGPRRLPAEQGARQATFALG